ncbi:MAG: hypothetical protein M1831_006673 [Alyxoria varia]|nr:MAG: hypothetical protein M1831_006673 [Alyxoria varia]
MSILRKLATSTAATMKLDSAVAKALALDPSNASVSSVGGGCSAASAYKITAKDSDKQYFMKLASGKEAETMFEGEFASLNAIHNAVSNLCPAAFGHGRLADTPSKSFLVTDFLDMSFRRGSGGSSAPSLASKMAKLHTTPAPIPEGYDRPMFGFPATTCCGDTPQPNDYRSSWAEFYAENRLRFILRFAEQNNGKDSQLNKQVNTIIDKVVPRLIGDDHLNGGQGVTPVVVHGDLWSGNASKGSIGNHTEVQDIVFDPSAVYAHNEFELGIMNMFGGFGSSFFKEYQQLCPPTEPKGEYDDRVQLYELYHHLNHYALFGGSYRSGATRIMKSLIAKYGGDKNEL